VQEVLLRVPIGSLNFLDSPLRRTWRQSPADHPPIRRAISSIYRSGRACPGTRGLSRPSRAGLEQWHHPCRTFHTVPHGVGLLLAEAAPASEILVNILSYQAAEQDGTVLRLTSKSGRGDIVDIREAGDFLVGRRGRGSVHHIAFTAKDDEQQARMADKLRADYDLQPTDQKDRLYFRSVYFREPGGILLEIATVQPGFTVDEPLELLGSSLKLPAFLEHRRSRIEAFLPLLGQAT
jgi:hypothetical protein